MESEEFGGGRDRAEEEGFAGFLPGTTHYRFRNHLDTNWPKLKHNVENTVEQNWEGFTDLKIPFPSNLLFSAVIPKDPRIFQEFYIHIPGWIAKAD